MTEAELRDELQILRQQVGAYIVQFVAKYVRLFISIFFNLGIHPFNALVLFLGAHDIKLAHMSHIY